MNYWKTREVLEREHLLDTTIKATEYELRVQYLRASKDILAQMDSLWYQIMQNGDKSSINSLYQYNRYYELLNSMNEQLIALGVSQERTLNKKFTQLYEQNAAIVGKQLHINTSVNSEQAKRVINSIWVDDGLNWSQRIWKNKDSLIESLKQGLFDSVGAGYSADQLKRLLMEKFNVSYNQASTLARTELAHIQITSTLDKYTEAGIHKYRYLATPDERECTLCSELNGQVFDIGNEHIPPMHPNCRCSILAVLE